MRVRAPAFYRRARIFLRREAWRRRIVFWCGGLCVGVAAVGLAIAANYVQAWFRDLVAHSPYLALVVTPVGLALSVWLMRRHFPGSGGSGIPQAIAARQFDDSAQRNKLLSLRIAVGKILLTLLGLLCGASAGREGPTVQVGASVMHAVGRAAAFNTPLAGIVFAIEEMSRSFEPRNSGLVLTAIIVAGIASLAILGDYTYFGHTAARFAQIQDWAAVLICGIAGGLLGGLFSMIVVRMAAGFSGRAGTLLRGHPVIFAACCSLLVAGIGILSGCT